MRLIRPWLVFRVFYPTALFKIRSEGKTVCLTFDDGPNPSSTPVILSELRKYDVKAVFFCTGKAAEEYPGLIDEIRNHGHLTGNHGYNHLDGWKTRCKDYCMDIDRAAALTSQKIFRPPFGHLRINQYSCLRKKYKIVFWDIMPYDFDPALKPSKSLGLLMKKIRKGSVIVLHDTEESNFRPVLGRFIESTLKAGYRFVLPV